MKVSFYRYMLAAFAAASMAASGAAFAQVDMSKSTVTAISKQMNVPVEGKFNKFTAQISFDPARPTGGSAQVTVGASGICEYCGGKLTRGEFDWVLSRIEQDDSYR